MAQPAQATGMATVLLIGTTGAGKSTLANLLVHGQSELEEPGRGFTVGHGPDAQTAGLKAMTRQNGARGLQVIDTPGVPDTDRGISLDHYDEIIKFVRTSDSINAIIIMVQEGRKDERAYEDMRALMKQFNTLPCGKIMVCRTSLPPRCADPEGVRKEKYERAMETMGRLCEKAGLSSVIKTILHDMDESEVQGLRNLICGMPDILRAGLQLRTFAEIEADLKQLSEQDSRVEALGKELERLSALKDQNQAVADKLAQRLETQQKFEEGVGGVFGFFFPAAADYVVDLCQKLTGFREANKIAEARVKEISDDIARKQAEVDNGRVDPEALAKAEAEFRELHTLRLG